MMIIPSLALFYYDTMIKLPTTIGILHQFNPIIQIVLNAIIFNYNLPIQIVLYEITYNLLTQIVSYDAICMPTPYLH